MKLAKLCPWVDDSAATLRTLEPSFKLFGLRPVPLTQVTFGALQDVVEELSNQLDVLDAFFGFIEETCERNPQMSASEVVLAHGKQAQILHLSGEIERVVYRTVFSNDVFPPYKQAPRVPKRTRRELYWVQWRHVEDLLNVYDHVFQMEVPVL